MGDSWRTPPEFFKICDDEFEFDLDAAASGENALTPNFISQEQDALVTPWEGDAVWCNPPYTLIGPFVKRAYEESERLGNTVCILLPAYTDPKYWSDYVMKAHEVRFLKGRLSFLDEDGMKKTSARFPSVLVVFKKVKGVCYGKAPNTFVWDWRK
jgi:site-specific DNA-methyltransferase (adenine-specific)